VTGAFTMDYWTGRMDTAWHGLDEGRREPSESRWRDKGRSIADPGGSIHVALRAVYPHIRYNGVVCQLISTISAGRGMGRLAGTGKTTCDTLSSINVTQWHRDGCLEPGRWFVCEWSRRGEPAGSIKVHTEPDAVSLSYRVKNNSDDQWQDVEQRLLLSWTACNFGGRRPWLICGCGQRVAIVYLRCGFFACRRCHKLNYASQHESTWGRGILRMQSIRLRLGGDPSLAAPFPAKPKGMHWRTYERWRQRAKGAEKAVLRL
jgi:hypothetical protein